MFSICTLAVLMILHSGIRVEASISQEVSPEESESTELQNPPVCLYGEWIKWSGCSTPCNTGHRIRLRRLISDADDTQTACDKTVREIKSCNSHPCPVDCELTQWLAWSTCREVGDGPHKRTYRFRVRNLIRPGLYGGRPCPPRYEETTCRKRELRIIDRDSHHRRRIEKPVAIHKPPPAVEPVDPVVLEAPVEDISEEFSGEPIPESAESVETDSSDAPAGNYRNVESLGYQTGHTSRQGASQQYKGAYGQRGAYQGSSGGAADEFCSNKDDGPYEMKKCDPSFIVCRGRRQSTVARCAEGHLFCGRERRCVPGADLEDC